MSVPIYDFAKANEGLAHIGTEVYYPCCGKSVCRGCIYSFVKSGNNDKCPFCNSKTNAAAGINDEQMMKRVEANDANSMFVLANSYQHGLNGFQQYHAKAMELYARAAELGSSKAQYFLGNMFNEGGDSKKAKFHYEAAAMAGHELARNNLGTMEVKLGIGERAVKHFKIAASAGNHIAMHNLLGAFNHGLVSRESIDSSLRAYNKSCAEMRSKARDAFIRLE
jgi:TPR repeat protein